MGADVRFTPLDDRGREILDELEQQTHLGPYRTKEQTGERDYSVIADGLDVEGFDPVLDRIDADWRRHLSRLAR
jgi:hypothetical protein